MLVSRGAVLEQGQPGGLLLSQFGGCLPFLERLFEHAVKLKRLSDPAHVATVCLGRRCVSAAATAAGTGTGAAGRRLAAGQYYLNARVRKRLQAGAARAVAAAAARAEWRRRVRARGEVVDYCALVSESCVRGGSFASSVTANETRVDVGGAGRGSVTGGRSGVSSGGASCGRAREIALFEPGSLPMSARLLNLGVVCFLATGDLERADAFIREAVLEFHRECRFHRVDLKVCY